MKFFRSQKTLMIKQSNGKTDLSKEGERIKTKTTALIYHQSKITVQLTVRLL